MRTIAFDFATTTTATVLVVGSVVDVDDVVVLG
jgi:hypothetical protein